VASHIAVCIVVICRRDRSRVRHHGKVRGVDVRDTQVQRIHVDIFSATLANDARTKMRHATCDVRGTLGRSGAWRAIVTASYEPRTWPFPRTRFSTCVPRVSQFRQGTVPRHEEGSHAAIGRFDHVVPACAQHLRASEPPARSKSAVKLLDLDAAMTNLEDATRLSVEMMSSGVSRFRSDRLGCGEIRDRAHHAFMQLCARRPRWAPAGRSRGPTPSRCSCGRRSHWRASCAACK
jgi:hypothetical protein